MSDEFPDPDDEFDLVHEDEYEVLKDLEGKCCKKQLNFSSQCTLKSPKKLSQQIQPTQTAVEQPATPIVLSPNGNNGSGENTKKRTIEELFGDIADLVGEDAFLPFEEPVEKRPRWDQEEEIIKKIVATREQLQEKWKVNHVNVKSLESKAQKRDTVSLRVPPWNFVAVTRCSDGQRLYLRVKSDSRRAVVKNRPASGLLSVSYSQLKAEAEDIIVKSVQRASAPPPASPPENGPTDNDLWVDKYRPRRYMELLSDETINRSLLHWLKLWDKIVFNRDLIKQRRMKEAPKFGSKKIVNKDIEGLDNKGFPVARIVLLSGAPGLGKTTLAHLAAVHAGYNVVEVNASDERGTEAFRQALIASTQMKSIMGTNPKPNCLILDEIDGAPTASVELLLKFVQGKLVGKSKKGSEKPKKESEGCRRPVICICNDAYAPSLRTLRAVAFVIPVPAVSTARLASRLMEIARRQGVTADRNIVMRLVERSNCDVRACLGALQYMGSTKMGDSFTVGLKDTRKGMFECWRDIFLIPRDRTGPLSLQERAKNALKVAYGAETERLAQGIFHNYPEIQFRDEGMAVVANSMEWFQFYDEIMTVVMSQQAWSVMPYTNHAFVAWHLNFAGTKTPQLTYPSITSEMNQKLSRRIAILAASRRSCGMDTLNLTLDVAPLLSDLLTPRLRSVSAHLYSQREQSDFTRLVDVMLDLGLSLVQDRNLDGGYEYNLEPNLEEVGIFPECRVRRGLTYAVKQILVQQLEQERLKRAEIPTCASDDKNSQPKNSEVEKPSDAGKVTPKTPAVPNHLRCLQPVAVTPLPEMQCRDFFGRVINKSPQQSSSTKSSKVDNVSPGTKEALTRSDVWFKYKEGYSNAVRRTVKMRDLL